MNIEKIKKKLKKLFNNKIFQFSLAFFLIVGTTLSLMINMMVDECRCYLIRDGNGSLIRECNTFPNCIDPDVPIPLTIVILVSIIVYIVIIKKMKKKNLKITDKEKVNESNLKLKLINKKKIIFISIGVISILIIIFTLFGGIFKEKIDVKGNTMLEYLTIVEKYGKDIDLDGVMAGANCFTGKQTKTIKSDKYGKVTVEFSYCKSSDSVYIHIYN